jgi:hypothetical protein
MKSLDYHLVWGRPAENYYALYVQDKEAKAHKQRLDTTHAVVNATAPISVPHLRINLKKQQVRRVLD